MPLAASAAAAVTCRNERTNAGGSEWGEGKILQPLNSLSLSFILITSLSHVAAVH